MATRDGAQKARLFPARCGQLHLSDRTWYRRWCRGNRQGFDPAGAQPLVWRFAKGSGGNCIDDGHSDVPSGPLLRIGDDRFVPGLRELVRVVHEASEGFTKVFIQLIDFLSIKRRPPREKFLSRFVVLDDAQRDRLARFDVSLRDADEGTLREALLRWTRRPESVLPRVTLSLGDGLSRARGDIECRISCAPRDAPHIFESAASRAREAA